MCVAVSACSVFCVCVDGGFTSSAQVVIFLADSMCMCLAVILQSIFPMHCCYAVSSFSCAGLNGLFVYSGTGEWPLVPIVYFSF